MFGVLSPFILSAIIKKKGHIYRLNVLIVICQESRPKMDREYFLSTKVH